LIPLKQIQSAKHIAVVVSSDELLPSGSALYTYLLRLHKKVSFVYQTNVLDNRFSFLPWFDKVRNSVASSVDLVVELDHKAFRLYDFFKTNKIKINKKMATALYASLLVEYDGFVSNDVNGMVFAKASELIVSGAEYRICNEFILKRTTLARLRLKSLMLKNMFLKNDAKEAVFYVCDADLKSTGATIKDATVIMKEALGLEYINSVSLVKSDQNNKILKLISKEI
jgi:phosphoesterase RecJ-like protein